MMSHFSRRRVPLAGQALRALLQQTVPIILGLLLVIAAAPAARAACDQTPVDVHSWTLSDRHGARWGLTLFSLEDPDGGVHGRLRLSARSPQLNPHHSLPLQVRDASGQEWSLPNRSSELIAPNNTGLPAATAQFDADALLPRPGDGLPLELAIPLAGQSPTGEEALAHLGPEPVQALHRLSAPPPRMAPRR